MHLSQDWTKVVDGIRLALTEALAEAANRVQTLEANPAFAEAPPVSLTDGLHRLDERLQALAACGRRAEQTAAEVGTILETGQQAVGVWRTAADSFRERLANWQRRSL